MILSVSRRTDIPAFYSEWFVQRLKDGLVYVQNPFNPRRVYSIKLSPHTVDFIVFWTKNPSSILKHLDTIEKLGYRDYYFLFTLNHYKTLELNLPSLENRIGIFKELSSMIGPEKVIWRYDPIIQSDTYGVEFHEKTFSKIAKELSGYTHQCKTSFLTYYAKIKNRIKNDSINQVSDAAKMQFLKQLQRISSNCNITLELCCEEINGLELLNSGCINKILIEQLIASKLDVKRDKNQRDNCQCVSSIDVGAYNTCNHQCIYCYANSGNIKKNVSYSIHSPLLGKDFDPEKQELFERSVKSNKTAGFNELNLFP